MTKKKNHTQSVRRRALNTKRTSLHLIYHLPCLPIAYKACSESLDLKLETLNI